MDIETLSSLSEEERYRVFLALLKILREEGFINKDQEDFILYGREFRFSMTKYYKYRNHPTIGIFREKPKNNQVILDGKKRVNMDEFFMELDERSGLIFVILMQYFCEDNDSIQPDMGEE